MPRIKPKRASHQILRMALHQSTNNPLHSGTLLRTNLDSMKYKILKPNQATIERSFNIESIVSDSPPVCLLSIIAIGKCPVA